MKIEQEKLGLDHPVMQELRQLAATRDHRLADWMTGGKPLTIGAASGAIGHLKGRPEKEQPEQAVDSPAAPAAEQQSLPHIKYYTDKVPDGRYAVPSLTGVNDLAFFKVRRPTEGKWAGYTFIDQVVGGKVDAPVKGYRARVVLQAILEFGPEDAERLYSLMIRSCRRCHRHLTDVISRWNAIGPDCAEEEGVVRQDPPAELLAIGDDDEAFKTYIRKLLDNGTLFGR